MLDTLGDRHHLDGLVVIWSSVIIREELVGDPTQDCERLWVIRRDGVSKNQPIEST